MSWCRPSASAAVRRSGRLSRALRPELLDVDVETHRGRMTARELLGHQRDALVVLHGEDLLVDWLRDGVRPTSRTSF
ncbi:MAG: hypothetical protein U0R76_07215 [Candidatus Nanopelagicales bacterium]